VVSTSSLINVPSKQPKVVVYLPPELKADLEALAKKELRPVSNMVASLIQQAVDKAKQEGKLQQ
jgi:hypothetical protein